VREDPSGGSDIYVVQSDGSSERRITNSPDRAKGATLTVNNGHLVGLDADQVRYTWQRCDGKGNGCSTSLHNPNAASYTPTEIWNYRDDLGLMKQLGAKIHAGAPTERS
jgi:hypothetical protein